MTLSEHQETQAEFDARLQRVTDQLSAAIGSVECGKEDMAALLIAHGTRIMIEVGGGRSASRSLYVLATRLAADEDLKEAGVAATDALRRAGAKMH